MQTGNNDEAYVVQAGNATLTLRQQADGVVADITQGMGQVLDVTQSTPNASVIIDQPASGPATITPIGAGVTITPTPADAGVAISVTQ